MTALFTLQELKLLPVLSKTYERILSPPSVIELLQQDRASLVRDIEKSTVTRIGPDPAGIAVYDVSRDELRREMEALDAMIEFLVKHTSAINRPLDSLDGDQKEVRKGLGDAEMDALLAATEDRPILSDDQGLRTIAEGGFGASSFSTVSLLHVAEERGLLTRELRLRATLSLIEAGHSFVPISAELLFAALREDGMVLGNEFNDRPTEIDRGSRSTELCSGGSWVSSRGCSAPIGSSGFPRNSVGTARHLFSSS